MTDVRLTALNPVDSQVYPVACNTSGELLISNAGPDLTVTGDLTVEGKSRFEDFIEFAGSISTPATAAAIYRPVDNNLAFSTASVERMRLDSNGRLLLGTATSITNATVQNKGRAGSGTGYAIVSGNDENAGGILLESSGTNALRFEADPSNLRSGTYIDFKVDNSNVMRLDSSGNVYIGGTNASSADIALNANGTATFTGNVTAPNITSLNALVNDLQTKMSLILRQIDISAETP